MKFKTIVCVTYYQEVTVEADSIEEAEELFTSKFDVNTADVSNIEFEDIEECSGINFLSTSCSCYHSLRSHCSSVYSYWTGQAVAVRLLNMRTVHCIKVNVSDVIYFSQFFGGFFNDYS